MKALTRRQLLKAAGFSAGMLATTQFENLSASLLANDANSDSLPMQLYKSLSEEQRRKVCLPVDHPRRQFVSNWWYIHPEHRIPSTFTKEQQELIRESSTPSTALSTLRTSKNRSRSISMAKRNTRLPPVSSALPTMRTSSSFTPVTM